jgi:2,3-bisphosphoglycerate-independent phosphoglycerate mutase
MASRPIQSALLTESIPTGALSLARGVQELYAKGQADYSIEPIVLTDVSGNPVGRIRDGDAVVFCCRRGEREIQLTEAFTEPGFDRFQRPDFKNLPFVILTLYHDKFKDLPVAFLPSVIKDTLSEVVSRAGLRQLHTAESEKFSHVTFFFNGGNRTPFPGEEDVRIPSPKGIPFDQIPQLSLEQVTARVLAGMGEHVDFIVANFANGDVIGHTSNNTAKIKCAEYIDSALGQVVRQAMAEEYVVLVTADHGNLEEMTRPDGSPHVAHTTNPVGFLLIDSHLDPKANLRQGKLADVAPTILSALDLEQPATMDGSNLVPRYDWGGRRRVLLLILDGWGIGRQDEANPIFLASTPVWDGLISRFPNSILDASGESVGLQNGKAGNSEAGHMNLGAGRVILQDDVRLEEAMESGSFSRNEILCRVIEDVKDRSTALHLIGLLSEKSSHGSIEYPLEILKMAKAAGLEKVFLHVIFDGRSTEPGSAPDLLMMLDSRMKEIGIGQVVTGIGRGIALDRDGNYAKIQRAYDALVLGVGNQFAAD